MTTRRLDGAEAQITALEELCEQLLTALAPFAKEGTRIDLSGVEPYWSVPIPAGSLLSAKAAYERAILVLKEMP